MGLFRLSTTSRASARRAGTAVAVVAGAVALTAACSQSGYHNLDTTLEREQPLIFMDSYVSAADAGDPVAQRVLGNMYYWGEEVERDDQKAAQWWRRAAQNGDERAAMHLANLAAGQPVEGELNPGIARNKYWPSLERAWADVEAEGDLWWNDVLDMDAGDESASDTP
jgi:TPR repeat protein